MNLYHSIQLIWTDFLRHECLSWCELLERGVSAAVNLFRWWTSSKLWLCLHYGPLRSVCLLSGSGDNLLKHVCDVGLMCVCWPVFEWSSSMSLYRMCVCESVFRDVRMERKHLPCSLHLGRGRENVCYQDELMKYGKIITLTAVLMCLL